MRAAAALACLLLGACAAMNHGGGAASIAGSANKSAAATASPSGSAADNTVRGYAAAIKSASRQSDHETDARVRAELAEAAGRDADACLALQAQAAACQYGKAVATGMQARVHPTQALGLLGAMLKNLDAAEAADATYDNGGPARVRALVLVRAPGWPVGPGDPEQGLAAARRAISVQPDYPPNVLALAECLSKSGDAAGAQQSYRHARELAQALPAGPERDDWLHTADEALAGK